MQSVSEQFEAWLGRKAGSEWQEQVQSQDVRRIWAGRRFGPQNLQEADAWLKWNNSEQLGGAGLDRKTDLSGDFGKVEFRMIAGSG